MFFSAPNGLRDICSVRFRANLGISIFLLVCVTYTPPYIRRKKGQIYHPKCNFFVFLLHFLCNTVIIKVMTNGRIDFRTIFQ